MHQFIPAGPATGSSSLGIHSVRGRENKKITIVVTGRFLSLDISVQNSFIYANLLYNKNTTIIDINERKNIK